MSGTILGIVGRKAGMTRIFAEDGRAVPVTVIEAKPNRITQVKTPETDGYHAVQVTIGDKHPNRINKPQAGQFAKASCQPGDTVAELRILEAQLAEGKEVGGEITLEQFEIGQKVDVTAQSKGKGFQGVIKRWNFQTQDMSHGNSLSHRAPGSIGQCQTPGKVWKGKKMAGHMGARRVTTQSLEIMQVDQENHLIMVKGAVPGQTGADVLIRGSVKAGLRAQNI